MSDQKKLNIDKLLDHPLISNSVLAQTIWPDIKKISAISKLQQKKSGSNYHKFLPDDIKKIEKALNDFWDDIHK